MENLNNSIVVEEIKEMSKIDKMQDILTKIKRKEKSIDKMKEKFELEQMELENLFDELATLSVK